MPKRRDSGTRSRRSPSRRSDYVDDSDSTSPVDNEISTGPGGDGRNYDTRALLQKIKLGFPLKSPAIKEKLSSFFGGVNNTAMYLLTSLCYAVSFLLGLCFVLLGLFIIYNLCSITELAKAVTGFWGSTSTPAPVVVTKYAAVAGYGLILYGGFLLKISSSFFYSWGANSRAKAQVEA